MKISFITTVKLCKGYEWIENALQVYINVIDALCTVPYEILIGEDLNDKNIRRVNVTGKNVRIIDVPGTYPNPLNFNMIESYSKNACLKEAKGEYACMTSADQILSKDFFKFLESGSLRHKVFYRFATYEIPFFDTRGIDVDTILERCERDKPNGHFWTKGCFEGKLTPTKLAAKGGDIMMLDTDSFRDIKGWPENICYHHVDYAVCIVAFSNFDVEVPPKEICTFTLSQPYRTPVYNAPTVNITMSRDDYQLFMAHRYMLSNTCN
jgi:hypothetical protein